MNLKQTKQQLNNSQSMSSAYVQDKATYYINLVYYHINLIKYYYINLLYSKVKFQEKNMKSEIKWKVTLNIQSKSKISCIKIYFWYICAVLDKNICNCRVENSNMHYFTPLALRGTFHLPLTSAISRKVSRILIKNISNLIQLLKHQAITRYINS